MIQRLFRRPSLPVLAAALALAAAVTYYPSLQNGFVGIIDDNGLVCENPKIAAPSGDALKAIWGAPHTGLYVPLVLSSYALEYRLFGLRPAAFHATNLLLHVVNALLVFWLFLLLTKRRPAAFIAALLFALHPLHVESVAWISERKDVLYAFFFLASFLLYLQHRDKGGAARYIFSLAAFLFSLLSKPMAVTLPLVLLATDRLLYEEKIKKSLVKLLPFFVLAALFGALNVLAQYQYSPRDVSLAALPSFQRLLVAGHSLVFYLYKAFLPFPLSFQYHLPVFQESGRLSAQVLVSNGILAALAALTVYSLRFTRAVAWGALFFGITLAPALNLVPFGLAMAADRYTYLPLLGLFYLIALAWTRAYDGAGTGRRLRPALLACTAVLLAGASFMSWERCRVWKDDLTLINDMIRQSPAWPHPYMALGQLYERRGDRDQAVLNLKKAIALDGANAEYHTRLGDACYRFGQWQEALAAYRAALSLAPRSLDASLGLVNACVKLGEYDTAKEAALKLNALHPGSGDARVSLGTVHAHLGEFPAAEALFNEALRLDPLNVNARVNLGVLYLERNERGAARAQFEKAAALNGGDREMYNNLGSLYMEQQAYEKALAAFRAAEVRDPSFPATHYNLGNLYLAAGAPRSAESEYRAAIAFAGAGAWPEMHFNLGVAYVRLGEHERAIQQFETIAGARPEYPGVKETLMRLRALQTRALK
ncbi:MAG: tetratricopeptide repeat protein [Endomicrobiales bacterium]